MNLNEPKVSVVIASKVGPPFIDNCLSSLENQKNAPDFEVIVVDCHGDKTQDLIHTKYPWVHLIPRESLRAIPDLRREGVEHARGEIIAILEEHCTACEEWLEIIARAHEGPYAAVGGSVLDYNYDRLRDWTTYFVEYNAYMPPVPAGVVNDLPMNNIAFKRDTLKNHLADLGHGYWEAFLFSKLSSDKAALFSEPRMIVYHHGPFNYLYYLRQRYLFSRAYAGAHRSVMPQSRRVLYVLLSPMLPALLLGRIGLRVWAKKCHVNKFLQCLPMILPVSVFYIAGEFIGYLFGAGGSLLLVE